MYIQSFFYTFKFYAVICFLIFSLFSAKRLKDSMYKIKFVLHFFFLISKWDYKINCVFRQISSRNKTLSTATFFTYFFFLFLYLLYHKLPLGEYATLHLNYTGGFQNHGTNRRVTRLITASNRSASLWKVSFDIPRHAPVPWKWRVAPSKTFSEETFGNYDGQTEDQERKHRMTSFSSFTEDTN